MENSARDVGQTGMWLVAKGGDGRGGGRIPLPAPLEKALIHWYEGSGSSSDEQVGITVVQQARLGEKWLACACLGSSSAPPILTPAYLSEAETYYLRRLTSARRPEHRTTCPFFRDQATSRLSEVRERQLPAEPPTGYFEIVRPAPEKLSQRPERDAVDDRTRHASYPKLALLLRRLLEAGGMTRWPTTNSVESNAIGAHFARLRAIATLIEVAPGIELGRVLWTHVDALHSRRVFAALRALAPRWPRSHAPQGFLLTFAREFHGHVVRPAHGEPFRVANRIQSPAGSDRAVEGPFLVLTVIGAYPEARSYAPLRAYAQPILSGHAFLAVDSDVERALIRTLLDIRPYLGRAGWHVVVEKPLFDTLSPLGTCRKDAVLEVTSAMTGEKRRLGFLIHEDRYPPPAGLAAALQATMPIIIVSPGAFNRPALLKRIELALETNQRRLSDRRTGIRLGASPASGAKIASAIASFDDSQPD